MKITALETIQLGDHPNITFVEVHTSEGLTGVGDTFRAPSTVAAYVHDVAAPLLLGQDARALEHHWQTLFTRTVGGGAQMRSTEIRGLSAIDTALWDIAAQAAGLPLYRFMGRADAHQPARLQHVCWLSLRPRGHRIDLTELERGCEPFAKIRRAVGNRMEVALEMHSVWGLVPAQRIAAAVEPFAPMWFEDPVRMDSLDTLLQFRQSTRVPTTASETLSTRWARPAAHSTDAPTPRCCRVGRPDDLRDHPYPNPDRARPRDDGTAWDGGCCGSFRWLRSPPSRANSRSFISLSIQGTEDILVGSCYSSRLSTFRSIDRGPDPSTKSTNAPASNTRSSS